VRALAALVVVLATSTPGTLTPRSEQTLPITFNQGIARVDGAFHGLVNDPAAGAVHLGHYDLVADAAAPSASSSPPSSSSSTATLPSTGAPAWLMTAALALIALAVGARLAARRRS